MSTNLKRVLEQFATMGVNPDWTEILLNARSELESLEESQRKLTALERGGVDNWEWYDDAMESLKE